MFSKYKGFSLAEIIVATSMFLLIMGASVTFIMSSAETTNSAKSVSRANDLLDSQIAALKVLKSDDWSNIDNLSEGSEYYFNVNSGNYEILSGRDTKNEYEYWFTVSGVERSSGGEVVESGYLDRQSRVINFNVQWQQDGELESLTSDLIVNNWGTQRWAIDTETELQGGTANGTIVETVYDNGEVRLGTAVYADWCNPSITQTTFDITGQGEAESIFAIPGQAVMGTGGNASGYSLVNTYISDTDPVTVAEDGFFDGHKANNVATDGMYGYIATDTNQKEVVIIDFSTTPYTEVGYVDTPGNRNAEAVYVDGDVGYILVNQTLHVFDLTSKSGSRSVVASHSLFDRGTYMVVKNDYAYVLIAGAVEELEIVDVSDPANPVRVGSADVNSGVSVTSINISEDENTLYIGANSSSQYDEVFLIDISSKTGDRPIIGSFDTGDTSVRDLEIVDNDTKAVVVGIGGNEYQVIDISNNAAPFTCGQLDIDDGVNAIAAVQFPDSENVYSYVMTDNSNAELMVIEGGAGGGDINGVGYLQEGEYFSPVLQTSALAEYYQINWDETLPPLTNLRIQMRSGISSDLSAEPWLGPDGTSNTYFTNSEYDNLNTLGLGDPYVQFRFLFTTDDLQATPKLNLFQLFYEE